MLSLAQGWRPNPAALYVPKHTSTFVNQYIVKQTRTNVNAVHT